jgi:uncharacterized heparinase superfamily protein
MILAKIRRGLRKPPRVIAKRLWQMASEQLERRASAKRAQQFGLTQLLKATQTASLAALWEELSQRPYFAVTSTGDHSLLVGQYPEAIKAILHKADLALNRQVDLLGSGLIDLGETIDWLKDYKTGFSWPLAYMRDMDYRNPERPSDVKFPWELSRMQWLIPAGQAYLLTGDERYALLVKTSLEQWIAANPYAYSVNWACTMEVALRIMVWTWFFKVFHASAAWSDAEFQLRFLSSLFLHAEFTSKHLEFSDINGNHYTADAAGLCFAGLFFGAGFAAERWRDTGWKILTSELPRQVFADGVDFEAATAYHRLVLELFFLPACYREAQGLPVPEDYQQRLQKMARYTEAYSRPDGSIPLCGDADDARALPFGSQPLNDHRYLCAWLTLKWGRPPSNSHNSEQSAPPMRRIEMAAEVYWLLGADALQRLAVTADSKPEPVCTAFKDGGFYIMRNATDHIFIDCGPLGQGGRGGHGHNDCLALEVMLNQVLLISDCGAYVYTASYEQRNLFRSTAYHNTPQIDEQEINRFVSWDNLWSFHPDAQYQVLEWQPGIEKTLFRGSHNGYLRLPNPVSLQRTVVLDHRAHKLTIKDDFFCTGAHHYQIPLHLAIGVRPELTPQRDVILYAGGERFLLTWQEKAQWQLSIIPARVSPSYGVAIPTHKLLWTRQGFPLPLNLNLFAE